MDKPFKVEGVDYSPEGIESVREALVFYRDNALSANNFEASVILSHAVAYLSYLKELVNE